MELEYITAGKIVNAHGVRGEVKILPWGAEADVLARCGTLYIEGRPLRPTAQRVHKDACWPSCREWTTWTPLWR